MESSKSSTLIGYLNLAHALDHFFILIYPAAVLALSAEFNRPYGELLPYSFGCFAAFGVFSMPVGWIGKWVTGHRLITVFLIGAGVGCVLAGFARTPLQIGAALTLVGAFAAIYHPIGNAMLSAIDPARLGRIMGLNGLCGNLGIASAALVTGVLTDLISWRAAFIVPGIVSIGAGLAFWALVPDPGLLRTTARSFSARSVPRGEMISVFGVLVLSTVIGSFIFNSTTIVMPKLFEARLAELTSSVSGIGLFVFLIYTLAAFAQILIGSLADRLPLSRIFLPLALLQVPFLLLTGLVGGVATLFAALAMMFLVFGQVPINEVMVARYTPPEYRTRVYSVRYTLGFAAMAASIPTVAYLHNNYGGFAELFILLAMLAVPLAVSAAILMATERRPVPDAAAGTASA